MAVIKVELTTKECHRYLSTMGLYKVWNDLMYPPAYMHEGELNHTLHNVYHQLERLHNKAFTYTMRGIGKKGDQKFEFKDEAAFEKSFGEYFERRLIVACLSETTKHPTYTKEQVAKKVSDQAKELFDQCVAYAYNELVYVIQERKILHGQQPFDFIV